MSFADDCVFCKILKGEIPCVNVFENDKVLAFLDIAPFNPGHTIIIPKEHHHSATTLPDEYLAAMMLAAPKIGAALIRATKAEGFNLFLNNGRVAGQVVPHVHLHVLPRFADDGVIISAKPGKYTTSDEMNALADAIRDAIRTKQTDD